jgi:hypothetical protein
MQARLHQSFVLLVVLVTGWCGEDTAMLAISLDAESIWSVSVVKWFVVSNVRLQPIVAMPMLAWLAVWELILHLQETTACGSRCRIAGTLAGRLGR